MAEPAPSTERLTRSRANPESMPRALRAILRDALAERLYVALAIADNPSGIPKDRLDALNLLARYGLGFPQGGATEGEGGRVLGVVILPALAAPSVQSGATDLLDPARMVRAEAPSLARGRRDARLHAVQSARAEDVHPANGARAEGARAEGGASPEPQDSRGPRETAGPAGPVDASPPPPCPPAPHAAPDMVGPAALGLGEPAGMVAPGGAGALAPPGTHPGAGADHPVRTPPYPRTLDGPRDTAADDALIARMLTPGDLPARATGKGGRGDMGGYGSHVAAEKWEVGE